MTAGKLPEIGDFVSLRGRKWLVERLDEVGEGLTATNLACVEDDAQGETIRVEWSSEIAAVVERDRGWNSIAENGADDSQSFAAYLRSVKWSTATAADRRLFQAPFRAGIRLDAYQLAPLYKALRLPRVNLLIADDVGLGKTIEAGLILRELLLRRRIDFLLVSAPPAMIPQWRDELAIKFGIDARIIDRDYLAQVRRSRGFLANPWSTGSIFLMSHRLLTDETYMAGLRQTLGGTRAKSLMILDEAHHAAPASGRLYAVDSQLTKAVKELAPSFEHRLFLTATPHNGHSNSFATLLEMLDPQRFTRGIPVRPKDRDAIMVRRLKADLRALGESFPERQVVPIVFDELPPETPELRLAKLLAAYGALRETRIAKLGRGTAAEARLVFSGLQQRLLSSPAAFAQTLQVHLRSLRKLDEATSLSRELARDFARPPAEPDLADEEEPEESVRAMEERDSEEAVEAATRLGALDANRDEIAAEFLAAEEMAALANKAAQIPDEKTRWIASWIEENMITDGSWNERRLIIFTEYEATRRWLQQRLAELLDRFDCEARMAAFTGLTRLDQREALKHAFNADPARERLRILLCTDAAREGINLQQRCYDLIHFDLPWNPSRLEQRNGRIDRKLQPAPQVFCRYFLYEQREADRVLAALVRKTERIRDELGAMGQVIEERIVQRLSGSGIASGSAERLVQSLEGDEDEQLIRQAREELEDRDSPRREKIKAEIDRLRSVLEDSRRRVGVEGEDLETVIAAALGRMGVSLSEDPEARIGEIRTYALDPEAAAFTQDPTWGDIFDELRARPRKRGEPLAAWRSAVPPRRLSFKPPVLPDGRDAEDVAQLHLEHRLVKRLLSRFQSQGFQHRLQRACVLLSTEAVPRVVLLGRLALFGPRAARLHEELIPVAAYRREAEYGKQPLRALAEKGDPAHLTFQALEQALGDRRATPESLVQRLVAAAARDAGDLREVLEQRAQARAQRVASDLENLAESEETALRALLVAQRDTILRTTKDPRKLQYTLQLDDGEERRQAESDRRHWERRLQELEREIEEEPRRLRQSYAVQAQRIEPIGLIYLWPETG